MIQPGDLIAGQFLVERELGKGGMGVVVAARHVELRKRFALKLMLLEGFVQPDVLERFLQEARAAASLSSPHAVQIHGVGNLDSGAPYIIMEYLEGQDLKSYVAARGRLPVEEASLFVLQACEAISEAHSKGIIHRDLKPANLFLAESVAGSKRVKVLDFGIAKVTSPDLLPTEGNLTMTGQAMGTLRFMSPEQLRSSRSADARSDIWSIGVILYNFVTGAYPFGGESVLDIAEGIMRHAPTLPSSYRPELPAALDEILLCCLQKDPALRFQTVADLAAALAPFAPPTASLTFSVSDASGLDAMETRILSSTTGGGQRTRTIEYRNDSLKLSAPVPRPDTQRIDSPSGTMPTGPTDAPWATKAGEPTERRAMPALALAVAGIAIAIIVVVSIKIFSPATTNATTVEPPTKSASGASAPPSSTPTAPPPEAPLSQPHENGAEATPAPSASGVQKSSRDADATSPTPSPPSAQLRPEPKQPQSQRPEAGAALGAPAATPTIVAPSSPAATPAVATSPASQPAPTATNTSRFNFGNPDL